MYGLLAYLLGALSLQEAVYGSPADPICALDRGAFCILERGMEIGEQAAGGEERITIRSDRFPEQAATLSYSQQCRSVRAASPRLVGYSPYDPEGGRIYLKLIFRIADGCFLTVSAPSYLDRESNLLGMSIMIGIVRLCDQTPCTGSKLGDLLPERLIRHLFSRQP